MGSAPTLQDEGLSGGGFGPCSVALSQNGGSRPRQPLRRSRGCPCIRNLRPYFQAHQGENLRW